MKVSVEINEVSIEIKLEPGDGTDKLLLPVLQGCTSAKVEVNGEIRFSIERPQRPLGRYNVNAEEKAE